jgi:DNA-binding transcriptional MerR regulator
VLRFGESEFPGLGPKKSGTGQRLYRRKDVEMVLEIKRLLYEKRFTIEGARKTFEEKPKRSKAAKAIELATRKQGELFGAGNAAFYQELRRELTEILLMLSADS